MTRKTSSWPSLSQVFTGALLASAHAIGQAQAGGSRALTLGGEPMSAGGGLPLVGGGAHKGLDRALKLLDTDLFSDRPGAGRGLKTAGDLAKPLAPGVTPVATPNAPQTPQAPKTPGIIPAAPPAAPSAPVAMLIPDAANYGACDTNVSTTLARVQLAKEAGADLIIYDTFAGNRSQSFDQNPARLGDAVKVVDYATKLGLQVLVGVAKDDVTMFTAGRPDLDRVPTNGTAETLLALAKPLGAYPNVALLVGGQPKNVNGSLTPEIAGTYGVIFDRLRAAGYNSNIIFKAPADFGRNLSYYANGNASYYQAQNIRFAIDLTSSGDEQAVNATIAQCNPLPCVIITGEQVSAQLGLNNTRAEVSRQLSLAAARGVPTVVTPFGDEAIKSSQGESVGLTGNVCRNETTAPALSSYGRAVLASQRAALTQSARNG